MQQGEALALQKLLTKRFGAIPADIAQRIESASLAEIEAWFDAGIDAANLIEIFGPRAH